jgi:hypothetical protein
MPHGGGVVVVEEVVEVVVVVVGVPGLVQSVCANAPQIVQAMLGG